MNQLPQIDATWQTTPACIRLTLISMHGDADAFTTSTLTYALDEEGKACAEFAVQVIEALADAIARRPESSTEDLTERIAKKHNLDYALVILLLDTLVVCQVRADHLCAMPVAYTLQAQDDQGVVKHAFFQANGAMRRYKPLTGISELHLRQWA